ncbi:unnamed protein product [Ixodes hexagonus]
MGSLRRFTEVFRMLLTVGLLAENGMSAPRDEADATRVLRLGDDWAESGPEKMRLMLVKRAIPLFPSPSSLSTRDASSLAMSAEVGSSSTNTSANPSQGDSLTTMSMASPTLIMSPPATAHSTGAGVGTSSKVATEETKEPTTRQNPMNETMAMVTRVSTMTSGSGLTTEEPGNTSATVVATESPTSSSTTAVVTLGTNASATPDQTASSASVGSTSTTVAMSSVPPVIWPNLPQMPHPIRPKPIDDVDGRLGVTNTTKAPGALNLPTLAQPLKPSVFYF